MSKLICLNENYSTTRMLHRIKNDKGVKFHKDGRIKEKYKWKINIPELNIKDSKKIGSPTDKFEAYFFLPEGEGRKGEGGLRTKGYFKKTYESKPLISIITVVFNGEKYLKETINSVINQTYDNVEYIIIDGGSTDGTLDIIKKYEHAIDYWVSEKDKGIYDAMNKGIDVATGKWINFLGSDDKIYLNGTIQSIIKYLINDFDLLCCLVKTDDGYIIKSKFSFKTYLHNTIHHQGAIYNKKLFNFFRYNIKFSITSDYELNLILFLNKCTKSKFINEIFSFCRNDGISRMEANKAFFEIKRIREKYFNNCLNLILNVLLDIKIFVHNIFK